MGILQRIERKLEGAVDDSFARVFGGKVAPQEVEYALQREAEDSLDRLGDGSLLAANHYVVTVGATDFDAMSEDYEITRKAFAKHLESFVRDNGWQTYGPVVVDLRREPHLHTGMFRAHGVVNPDAPAPAAVHVESRPTHDADARQQPPAPPEPGAFPMTQNPGYDPRGGHEHGRRRDVHAGEQQYDEQQYAPGGQDHPRDPYDRQRYLPEDPAPAGGYAPEQEYRSGNDYRSPHSPGAPYQQAGGYYENPQAYSAQPPADQQPHHYQPPGGYGPAGYGPSGYGAPPAQQQGHDALPDYPQQPAYDPQQPAYDAGRGYESYQPEGYQQSGYPRQPEYGAGNSPAGYPGYQGHSAHNQGRAERDYHQYPQQDYDQNYGGQNYSDQNYGYSEARYAPSAIVLSLEDGSNRTFTLRDGNNIVGRGQDAQFRLPDTGVSRRHVEIRWDGHVALLTDLNSTNGTTVNDVPVSSWELADGDRIRVGHSDITVRFQ